MFLGNPGYVSAVGFVAFMSFVWAFTSGVGGWYIGKRIVIIGKKYSLTTPGEAFRDYYESDFIGILVAVMSIILLIPWMVTQLMGSGYAWEVITAGKIPFTAGMVFLLAVAVVYVVLGGMRAVAWTDVLQGAILWVGLTGVALYIVYGLFNGHTDLFRQVADKHPNLITMKGGPQWGTWIGLVLGNSLLICVPVFWIRANAVKSLVIWKKSIISMSLMIPMVWVAVFLIGYGGRLLYPDLAGDKIVVSIISDHFPYLGSFLLAAALAAGMSTADSILLTISSHVVKDILEPHTSLSVRQMVNVSRIVIVAFGVVALLFAYTKPGYLFIIGASAFGAMALFVIPTIGLLFWSGATKHGVIAGLISGLIVDFFFFFWKLKFLNLHWSTLGILVGVIVLIVVSKFTEPCSPEKVEKYHGLIGKVLQ